MKLFPRNVSYASRAFERCFCVKTGICNLPPTLPRNTPNHIGIAVEFATYGNIERNCINEEIAKAIIENIESFDPTAFSTDEDLFKQLISFKLAALRPLGIVLVSPKSTCTLCGENLSLCKDHPSSIVVYDDTFGTASGSHYYKYCSSRTCTVKQYYGYYTTGQDASHVVYNSDWKSLPFLPRNCLFYDSTELP